MAMPKFAWSTSRAGMLRECPRKYFWNYYGSWEGWTRPTGADTNADRLRRRAYALKQITDLQMYFGDRVHSYLADTVKRKQFDKNIGEKISEAVRKDLRAAILSSRDENAWTMNPKHRTMLLEEFCGGVKNYPDAVASVNSKLEGLKRLGECRTFKELPKAEILEVDEDLFKSDFGKFVVDKENDITAYALIDVLYKIDGKYVIVDWKTSADEGTERYHNQVIAYAYYVMSRYGAKPEDILCRVENVVNGISKELRVSMDDINRIHRGIIASIGQMAKYVKDGDLKKNEQIGAKHFEKKIGKACRRCVFSEFCHGVRCNEAPTAPPIEDK